MPKIILENVTKRFEKFIAVDNLNMVIDDRSFITLLGPSGCGKTTTLRMIAGLETPTEGRILIDDKVVFSAKDGINVPPDKRDVGFLFQNYALWPHMTVNQNIAFGLENLKWSKADIIARTKELLEMLKISEFGERYPAELSGGQQQRVAIARTLATRPKVLFMDEPLSNLDAKLRTEMRTELKRLHKNTDSTFIYVTHDQLEAMTLSTKVCLMKTGVLQQYAPPLTVYNKPANMFTADFVGSPTINFVSGVDLKSICPNVQFLKNGQSLETDSVMVGIRPEAVQLSDSGKESVSAKVYSTLPSGMETILKLNVETGSAPILTSVVFGDIDFEVDTKVNISFNTKKMVLFEKDSTALIDGGTIEL
ncbi:MAG: ABC transporter ATP-binding protein [Treponema sp.]|nr:ABC transporter ATP-binding protein [Treponema sp.]